MVTAQYGLGLLTGLLLGGGAVYLWASLVLAKRDPPHGLDDEALAERAMLAESQRMDTSKAANRANRRVRAFTTTGGGEAAARPMPPGGLGRWGSDVADDDKHVA